tara:strand:+ start:387 stop:896 length:510 start_codon:yes stop_codon:yes gene_type:complete
MIKNVIYGFLWFSIGLISAVDVYWSIVLQDVLVETELNPMGKFLINIASGDIALFMCFKVAGLVVVLGLLTVLYSYKKRLAWMSIVGVAIFQFWLLWYLNVGEESTLQKAKKYHEQARMRMEALQCPPMTISVNPADKHLKQDTDLMIFRLPAQSAKEQNSNKSSTPLP